MGCLYVGSFGNDGEVYLESDEYEGNPDGHVSSADVDSMLEVDGGDDWPEDISDVCDDDNGLDAEVLNGDDGVSGIGDEMVEDVSYDMPPTFPVPQTWEEYVASDLSIVPFCQDARRIRVIRILQASQEADMNSDGPTDVVADNAHALMQFEAIGSSDHLMLDGLETADHLASQGGNGDGDSDDGLWSMNKPSARVHLEDDPRIIWRSPMPS